MRNSLTFPLVCERYDGNPQHYYFHAFAPDDESLFEDASLPACDRDFETEDTVCVVNQRGAKHYVRKALTFALPTGAREDLFDLDAARAELTMSYDSAKALGWAGVQDLQPKQIDRIRRQWCRARGFKPQHHDGKFDFAATLAAAGARIPWDGGNGPDQRLPRMFEYSHLPSSYAHALCLRLFKFHNRGKWVVAQSNAGFCDHRFIGRYTTYSDAFPTQAEAEAQMQNWGGASYKVGGTYQSGYGNYDRIRNHVEQL